MNHYVSISPYELGSNKLPDLLIIITPLMRKNFEKYGRDQFTSFDFTFNLIKDAHPDSNMKYKLGCFMGLSNCRKLVPFALVIT